MGTFIIKIVKSFKKFILILELLKNQYTVLNRY